MNCSVFLIFQLSVISDFIHTHPHTYMQVSIILTNVKEELIWSHMLVIFGRNALNLETETGVCD